MMNITSEDKKQIKRLWILLRCYKFHIVLTLICIIATSLLGIAKPWIGKLILDKGFIEKDITFVYKMVGLSLIVLFLEQGINLIKNKYQSYIASIFPYDLNKMAVKKITQIQVSYFKQTHASEIIRNLDMDIQNISRIIDKNTFYIVTQFFTIVGGLVGLLLIDLKLTLLVMAIVPVRYFAVKYLAKCRRTLVEEYMEQNQKYSSWLGDLINGIKEIKLGKLKHIKLGQFIRMQRSIININIKLSYADRINEISEEILFELVNNVLYIIGAIMIFKNQLSLGSLVAFINYSMYVTAPISAITNIGYTFSGVLPAARRFFEFMDMPVEGQYEMQYTRQLEPRKVEGNLKFDKVNFSYEGEIILKDISFVVQAKEKVAIIGSNGSGKSTLLNLMLRFEQPESGHIFLDEQEVTSYCIGNYREVFSVIFQDFFLFNTTVSENVGLFLKSQRYQGLRNINNSYAYEYFYNCVEQYKDSLIGVNGSKLSGGERQKVALMRALNSDKQIFIMDEVTSNMDNVAESWFNQLIEVELKNKTVIIITHRMNVLKKMDKIILLHNGEIYDIGAHNELIERNMLYRTILNNSEAVCSKSVV